MRTSCKSIVSDSVVFMKSLQLIEIVIFVNACDSIVIIYFVRALFPHSTTLQLTNEQFSNCQTFCFHKIFLFHRLFFFRSTFATATNALSPWTQSNSKLVFYIRHWCISILENCSLNSPVISPINIAIVKIVLDRAAKKEQKIPKNCQNLNGFS